MTPEKAIAARLDENLQRLRAEIEEACARSGRAPRSVELLAVVKYVGAEVVRLLAAAGLKDFGEGTVQGAAGKISALPDLAGSARWHLVGHLQRNKARKAVAMFAGIHSLDSLRLARTLEEALALEGAAAGGDERLLPRFYIEVNLAREPQKTGVLPEEAEPLLEAVAGLPRVRARLLGLMAMAPHAEDAEASRPHFRALRELRERLAARGLLPPEAGLSMGMSADFPVAVEEGATVVRVGTRLFEHLPEDLACRSSW